MADDAPPPAPPPAPPRGLASRGRELWRSVVKDYDLDVHERALLLQACRCSDRLDELARIADAAPALIENAKGDLVAHPALIESRLQSITLSRLLASMRIPTGEAEDASRPQRRGMSRGAYGIRGAV